MSGPPVRPRSRELEIVRVLFDKHLLERAVNLAEARWAGSGEMVRLAYHWQDFSPTERREQLERIGPEQLSQFRALADLDPELAKVLETLEARGVLPPAADISEADDDLSEDVASDAGIDTVTTVEPTAQPKASPPPPPVTRETVDFDDREDVRAAARVTAAAGVLTRAQRQLVDRDEVERIEHARREDALRSGEELLQRVRARLDSTARRVTSNPIGSGTSASPLPAQLPAQASTRSSASAATVADDDAVFSPPPEYWINRLTIEQVVVVDSGTSAPTDDQLVGLSNEFGLELHEFHIEPGSARAQFGGLKRSGTRVDVSVGPLPAALSRPSLVVVHGRLFSRQESRLRQGFCDIPGTRKSVALDARARVIVVP